MEQTPVVAADSTTSSTEPVEQASASLLGGDKLFTDVDDSASAAMDGKSGGAPGPPVKNSSTVAVAVPMSSPQPQPQQPPSSRVNSKNIVRLCIGTAILLAVIVLAVVLTQGESPAPEVPPPPTVDFSTGVSLVTSYAIETKVRSRLARTTIAMEVANALDCSSIHVISLQLPLDTRITSVKTIADDGCTSTGDVQELGEARENFIEAASNGLPVAYVEAQDSSTHSLQVAIPPLGTSNVELVLEQLLKQRLDEVTFEIPLAPNEKVDSVVFDLMVEDTAGEPVKFEVDLSVPGVYEPSVEGENATETGVTEPIHLDIPDARQHDLPQIIRGTYKPGKLPENGLLFTDGRCFEHFFHPSSLAPMPRNFVFLLDTSHSMQYHSKMESAQEALWKFVDSLKPEDTFTIQTFGNKGTEQLWGSGPGTDSEKEDAKKFIASTQASRWNTNLHEAFLEGLLRAKHDAEVSDDDAATILVVLSDGHASRGETNRTKIAEHVYELNREGTVKIFSLGFQGSSDMQLLDAIALMNGGVSKPLLQGQDSFADQITNFLDSELGTVLMSDVNVRYFSDPSEKTTVYGETQNSFPLLAKGYEVVVRGLIAESDGDTTLNTITSASTIDGIESWELSAAPDVGDAPKSSLCFQSYAHDRITQLLRLYEASDFLGNDLVKRLVTLSDNDCKEEDFAKCIRAEALALAVEANVVAKGLTAMVTIDDDECMKLDEEAEVCLDGTTPDGWEPARDESDEDYAYNQGSHGHTLSASVPAASPAYEADSYPGSYAYSGASARPHGLFYFFALFSAWFFVAVFKI